MENKEELQWNKMMDLWVQEKLESPYLELIEYVNGVSGEGHYCHFDNVSDHKDLKQYVDVLVQILPEILKENLIQAYDAYTIDEDEEVLNHCDDVYYDNEEIVNHILKEHAMKIEL